jgi:hypothetical protein
MNEQQQAIWNYLRVHAVGKRNAVHMNKIASDLEIPDYGTNNDDVRASIADLVDKGQPIGTCRDGAFLTTNETSPENRDEFHTSFKIKLLSYETEKEEAAQFLDRNTRSTAIRRNGLYTPK